MCQELFKTKDHYIGLVLRLTLGAVMFPHGAAKLFGWFGGHGFSASINFFTSGGMPWIVAFLVIIGESLGALGLIFGFLTRFCAGSIFVIMLGAISMVHAKHGFFMNWFGKQEGEGFEYHLLVVGICVALMICGGGKWSVDRMITKKTAVGIE